MNLLYKKSSVLIVAGLVYLAGQYFRGVWFLNFFINVCRNSTDQFGKFCNSQYINTLGWPLIMLGQMLAIVWLILLLANEKTFYRWLKVSAVYIPIAVLLSYLIYPIRFAPGTDMLPISYGIYPFGTLYILITLGIVLMGWWRSRKQSVA